LQRYSALSDAGDAPAACTKVLKTYDLDKVDIMDFLQIVDSPLPGGATPGFMQIGATIADKAAFFRDAKVAMTPIDERLAKLGSKSDDVAQSESSAVAKPDLPTMKLSDVKIDGEKAEGAITIGDDGGKKQPINFVREKGSWVVAVASKEPDWKQPIQGRFRFSDFKK
jgi:hypothetical protein